MRRATMEKAREILRQHFELELSQREIAQSVSVSLGTVSNVITKARNAGIEYPLKLSNKELGSIIYPPVQKAVKRKCAEPNMEYIHKEMQKKGLTLTLLWEEYKTENPDGLMLTQFCERYRTFRKQNDVYMRKNYKAGERVMVDWAGLTMSYTDEHGEERPAYIFAAVLPASSYMYVEAFRDMQEKSWIGAHVHAFEYFGGAPVIAVPDNTKTGITKADYHDPELHLTYWEMAKHYGVAIVPARVKKARDKAPAEKGVQIAERRIIAKLRHRQFHSFTELHEAVREQMGVVNQEPFKKLPGNRLTLFEEIEKPELRPLPSTRYEFADWKKVKSSMDYHVQYDNRYYSIPYLYAGKQMTVRATTNIIEVFCDHERIASHIRNYSNKDRYTTLPEHMPSNHRAVADWTPERFVSWAGKFGPNTQGYISYLMGRREHPEQAYKTCAGILRMGETLATESMEAICGTAIEKNIYTYKYFSILFKQMAPEKRPADPIQHKNLRGSGYYGGGTDA